MHVLPTPTNRLDIYYFYFYSNAPTVISRHKNSLRQFGDNFSSGALPLKVGFWPNDEARTLLLWLVLIDAGRKAGERTKSKALGDDILMGDDMVAIVPRPPSVLSQFHTKCD